MPRTSLRRGTSDHGFPPARLAEGVPVSACAASKLKDFVSSHISVVVCVSDAERVVRLQAESPLRMAQAIVDGARGVFARFRPVHRLQREPLEIELRKIFRAVPGCG